MKTWIVLPAYNEAEALPPLLDSIIETFTEEGRKFSVIAVDDGSSDGTYDIIKRYAQSHPIIPLTNGVNKGLAETLRLGLMEAAKQASSSDVIITMDADNTHPAGLALRMVRIIREGSDIVIASRYQPNSHIQGLSFGRILLSIVASWLFRILFPIKGVKDFTCGYRAYRAHTIQGLIQKYQHQFISEKGFSCMVDILLRLRELPLVFTEVPLILRYDLKPGQSKMKVLQTCKDTLKLIIRRRIFS